MKNSIIASALALPLVVPSVHAQDDMGVHISGFGTAALTFTNSDKAEFVRYNQPSGAAKTPRTGVDSNLGLQADYKVNDWLSVTGQGLVRKDAQDDYGAELTMAFAKAKVSDSLSLRAGRTSLPVFMISDYRNVGYANTMLRPPQEVYSQVPMNSLDGIDGTWQTQLGGTSLSAQLGVGVSEFDMTAGAKGITTNVKVLNVVAEHGPFTLRFGRFTGNANFLRMTPVEVVQGNLANAAAAYPTEAAQLNEMYGVLEHHDTRISFTSVGMTMDWNDIVLQSEVTKRKFDNFFFNTTSSWYVMAGYRFGKLLPYASREKRTSNIDFVNTVPTSCPAGSPAACAPTMSGLHGAMEGLRNAFQKAQMTDTIGLRWDAFRSAAVKVQVDRVKPQGTGLFVNAKPGFHGPVTVGAVAIDFVF